MMMNMLVVARKYNDIFYAMSTDEWKMCDKHYLLMIVNTQNESEYPMSKAFDKVYVYKTNLGTFGYIKECISIKKISSTIDYSIVAMSNPAKLANYGVFSNRKIQNVVLLEDGLMNYYNFKPSFRLSKRIISLLLGLNMMKNQVKIKKTYLLHPDMAKFSYGDKVRLKLKAHNFEKYIKLDSSIDGKKIFVGQALYKITDMSLEEYSEVVNQIISDKNIDYYLPHRYVLVDERIKCPSLALSKYLATLEILAAFYTFEIYSFSSSVLYTTKLINPSVKSHLVSYKKAQWVKEESIIDKVVDEVIEL